MSEVILKIAQGKVRGRIATDLNGNTYKSFQGIPYAKPPIGKLRFMPPQPPEPWTENILDATKERSHCYGPNFLPQKTKYSGSEDCLFVNVYTPKLENETREKLPVMVWIHGGAFFLGSGNTDLFGPEFLVAKNIVLVTLNYRLGFLGFLRLNDSSCGVTGNAGLKDQTEALRWVQKNISAFGGDPNNVTLFGGSAGSASVSAHLLSSLSKGVFHKAILQSGVVLCPWANQIRRDYEFIKFLGCTATNDKEILSFLQDQYLEDILDAQRKCLPIEVRPCGEVCDISPNIEPNIPSALLSDTPENILRKGEFNQVPIMIGINDKEGLLMANDCFKEIADFDIQNSILIPRDLKQHIKTNEQFYDIINKIRLFYNFKNNSIASYTDFWTDSLLAHKHQVFTREWAQKSTAPVYNYLFKLYVKGYNTPHIFDSESDPGANHGDELAYLFNQQTLPKVEPNTQEALGVQMMTTLWTNFARTGNPNPINFDKLISLEWKPFTIDNPYYLVLDSKLELKKDLFDKRVKFWDSLYKLES